MRKSASVKLTLLAAVALGAHAQQRLDPCSAGTFNEQACKAAVQSRGYCWNDRWVRMKYSQPFPYYYDSYQQFLTSGGVASPAAVGTCGPSRVLRIFARGGRAGGFGRTGAGHPAHG